MQNWSNKQIFQMLCQQPGRLRQFLLQIPINELRTAVEVLQVRQDLGFALQRTKFAFKKNVLDMNLQDVIMACYNEGIIDFFQRRLAIGKTRIQNHPEYGIKLVNRHPDKYYVGERSSHYHHARQIEQAYGIANESDSQSNEEDKSNNQSFVNYSQEQLPIRQQNRLLNNQGGEDDRINDQDQLKAENSKDFQDSQSDDSFIVDDSQQIMQDESNEIIDEESLVLNTIKQKRILRNNQQSNLKLKIQKQTNCKNNYLQKQVEKIDIDRYLVTFESEQKSNQQSSNNKIQLKEKFGQAQIDNRNQWSDKIQQSHKKSTKIGKSKKKRKMCINSDQQNQ